MNSRFDRPEAVAGVVRRLAGRRHLGRTSRCRCSRTLARPTTRGCGARPTSEPGSERTTTTSAASTRSATSRRSARCGSPSSRRSSDGEDPLRATPLAATTPSDPRAHDDRRRGRRLEPEPRSGGGAALAPHRCGPGGPGARPISANSGAPPTRAGCIWSTRPIDWNGWRTPGRTSRRRRPGWRSSSSAWAVISST